ncbi:hypothetical protein Tco_1316593 [Tanacetum coccineum]
MKDRQEGTEQEAGADVNSVVNDVSSSWAQNEKEAGGSSTQIRRGNRPRNPPRNLDLPRIYVKNRGRFSIIYMVSFYEISWLEAPVMVASHGDFLHYFVHLITI